MGIEMTVHCQRCDCPYANFVLIPVSPFESVWMWLCEDCMAELTLCEQLELELDS